MFTRVRGIRILRSDIRVKKSYPAKNINKMTGNMEENSLETLHLFIYIYLPGSRAAYIIYY